MEHHQTNMLQGSCGIFQCKPSLVHQIEFSHENCIVKTVQVSIWDVSFSYQLDH